MNWTEVQIEEALGYVSCQQHPTAPLKIYNYTAKCQYDWRWNEVTKKCRGLIADASGRIVSRPFEKFFSYEQLGGVVPQEPFEVFEKMDGSLGVSYWDGDMFCIATRGSFISEQAKEATYMLMNQYKGVTLDKSLTYLFEIIYPENRIVVNYGDRRELVLLSVIDTESGEELPLPDIGFPVVHRYDGIADFAELTAQQDNEREGYVVRFQSGQRVKLKFDEYKRLHKLLTGVSPRTVWDCLRSGTGLADMLERVPDEYYQWVQRVESDLQSAYADIESAALRAFEDIPHCETRREFAELAKASPHASMLFAMLDGKDYSKQIWQRIRPVGTQAFRCDIDV